jgi:hypothetical protein
MIYAREVKGMEMKLPASRISSLARLSSIRERVTESKQLLYELSIDEDRE